MCGPPHPCNKTANLLTSAAPTLQPSVVNRYVNSADSDRPHSTAWDYREFDNWWRVVGFDRQSGRHTIESSTRGVTLQVRHLTPVRSEGYRSSSQPPPPAAAPPTPLTQRRS